MALRKNKRSNASKMLYFMNELIDEDINGFDDKKF